MIKEIKVGIEGGRLSNIFIRPTPDCGFKMISNLKQLSENIEVLHFNMESKKTCFLHHRKRCINGICRCETYVFHSTYPP